MILNLLAIFYGILQSIYIVGWVKTKLYVPDFKIINGNKVRVSVIVAARNEEKNVEALIYALHNQSYSKDYLEIIIINDHSEDRTLERLRELTVDKNNFIILDLADYVSKNQLTKAYKKTAISLGIKKSKGEFIITTDADCTMENTWVNTMVSYYLQHDVAFITGPVLFTPKPNFLSIFQFLDMAGMMVITAASIKFKLSPMSNGANLAYPKKIFEEVKGFQNIDNIASGDDILLMEKIWELYPQRIHYVKSDNCIVKTQPALGLREFYNQRVRWTSKTANYKSKKIKILLGLVYIFNLLLLLTTFYIVLKMPAYTKHLIFSWGIKLIADFLLLYTGTSFFKNKKYLLLYLPSQLAHILYVVIIGAFGNFSSFSWKGRKI